MVYEGDMQSGPVNHWRLLCSLLNKVPSFLWAGMDCLWATRSPVFCWPYGPVKKAEHTPWPASLSPHFHYGHKGDSSIKARTGLCQESGVPPLGSQRRLGTPLPLTYSTVNMICLPPHWARKLVKTSLYLIQLLKNILTSKHSAILSLLLNLFCSFQCVCVHVCVLNKEHELLS